MAITYEDITPSLMLNTIMQKAFIDGIHKIYVIKAEEGYVLHDKRIDEAEYDLETGIETGNIIPRFKLGSTTVAATYDFDDVVEDVYTHTDENGMEVIIPVVKIGEYEFYTLPEDQVSSMLKI